MLGNSKARDIGKLIATPFAKIFIKLGFSPDLVTLFGTLGVVASSIVFFSQGEFLVGSILCLVCPVVLKTLARHILLLYHRNQDRTRRFYNYPILQEKDSER